MKNKFQFLSYAGYYVTTSKDYRILIDPFLDDNPRAPYKTDKIERADLIIVTHGAWDHVGDTGKIAQKHDCWVVCPDDVKFLLIDQGVDPDKIIATAWGITIEVDGIKVKPVENHHRSTVVLSDGRIASSTPLAFIVYLEDGTRVYIAGDTAVFSDMKLQGELYRPDIGLINVCSDAIEMPTEPGRPKVIMGEMSPYEAALCSHWLNLKVVLPCHYQTLKNEQLHEYVKIMETMDHPELPPIGVVVLDVGESYEYSDVK
jgi:Predicted Zn-dependent hydrolases of the beta-lactamase fold